MGSAFLAVHARWSLVFRVKLALMTELLLSIDHKINKQIELEDYIILHSIAFYAM